MITVLIVEDNDFIRMALVQTVELNWEGVRVLEAGDGPTGLTLALSEQPQVMLVDGWLPAMDGPTLITRARAAGLSDCVMVGLTGTDSQDPIYQSLFDNCDHFLEKPFALDAIIDVLHPYCADAASGNSYSG